MISKKLKHEWIEYKNIYGKWAYLIIGLCIGTWLFVGGVSAQSAILANQGAPGKQGPWLISGTVTATGTDTVIAKTSCATTETLVLNSASTATPASALAARKWIEIQNLGPNSIFCRCDGGTDAVVNKAHRIISGEYWFQYCDNTACVCECIAATADQVTGAGTIVTECK